jgi:hypothetical protein
MNTSVSATAKANHAAADELVVVEQLEARS